MGRGGGLKAIISIKCFHPKEWIPLVRSLGGEMDTQKHAFIIMYKLFVARHAQITRYSQVGPNPPLSQSHDEHVCHVQVSRKKNLS